ncbi:DUF3833 family protein [Rhodopila sp.]|uniref:DUF3833 family protein n=1 Tax=Rhodopila sp. TaxID=2480087 RepID=UPI003D0C503E
MIARPIRIFLLLAICLTGCDRVLSPRSFAGSAPRMLPEDFFAGATASTGVLQNRAGAPTGHLRVVGLGQALPDGIFRLVQTVTVDQDAPQTRTWLMHRLDAHNYTATLTGASGPVRGQAYGNLFHLRYAMKTPFGGEMEQWLYLQPDGRTVMNEATIRVFGIVVAHISERITRQGS